MNRFLTRDKIQRIQRIISEELGEFVSEGTTQTLMLENIAKKENIKLLEADLKDVSGILFKDQHDQWVIMVNKDDSQRRKIFTTAHELGHYFLHKNGKKEFIDGQFVNSFHRDETEKYQIQEIEANEFAGNLIMPSVIIEKEIGAPKQVGLVSEDKIKNLADRFEVSTIAMTTRLRNLGYVTK